jgi:hypothetical protein
MAWLSEWSRWDTDITERPLAVYETDPMCEILTTSVAAGSNESECDVARQLSSSEGS